MLAVGRSIWVCLLLIAFTWMIATGNCRAAVVPTDNTYARGSVEENAPYQLKVAAHEVGLDLTMSLVRVQPTASARSAPTGSGGPLSWELPPMPPMLAAAAAVRPVREGLGIFRLPPGTSTCLPMLN